MVWQGGFRLRKGIHPDYKKAMVKCACGNTFETRSTIGDIHVDICSSCHPFFTGRQKLVDTAGRVEKYMKKYKLGANKSQPAEAKEETKTEESSL
jgi:large subunit ribosomal protein L31